mgnify:CR=1 FL=1
MRSSKVTKLEDEAKESKLALLEIKDCLCKNKLKETVKEEKMGIISHDVNEMKNICTT